MDAMALTSSVGRLAKLPGFGLVVAEEDMVLAMSWVGVVGVMCVLRVVGISEEEKSC